MHERHTLILVLDHCSKPQWESDHLCMLAAALRAWLALTLRLRARRQVKDNLAAALGKEFRYSVRPWEGGDKVRKVSLSSVFVDIFTLTRYASREDLTRVIGVKKNGACVVARTPLKWIGLC
jgi:hypothetical protein